jgi:hypothetical protein
LHEIGRKEPMTHIKLAKDKSAEVVDEGAGGKTDDQPVKAGNPFAEPDAVAPKAANPFGDPDEKPAGDAKPAANPFDDPAPAPSKDVNPFDDPAGDAKPKVDKEAENPFG